MPRAVADTLTMAAFHAQRELPKAAARVLDRPRRLSPCSTLRRAVHFLARSSDGVSVMYFGPSSGPAIVRVILWVP